MEEIDKIIKKFESIRSVMHQRYESTAENIASASQIVRHKSKLSIP